MEYAECVRGMFLGNLWRWSCGSGEVPVGRAPSLDDLSRTEWSVDFEGMMRRRMIMGALRYGSSGAVDKPRYDRVGYAERKLAAYRMDGNGEHLVDVANVMMLEYEDNGCQCESVDDGIHQGVR